MNQDHSSHHHTILKLAYKAFNARDIDGALALMTEDVRWPKASEGGEVIGKEEVGAYWTRQWLEFNPTVEPLQMDQAGEGSILVRVHQVVRDLTGNLLFEGEVVHIFQFRGGLISAMRLGGQATSDAEPSQTFRRRS